MDSGMWQQVGQTIVSSFSAGRRTGFFRDQGLSRWETNSPS